MISEKRGVLGGGILMVSRVLMVIFIAFVIFGIASVFYAYYIDVRDAEAAIMGRNVVKCLASDGFFDLDKQACLFLLILVLLLNNRS